MSLAYWHLMEIGKITLENIDYLLTKIILD